MRVDLELFGKFGVLFGYDWWLQSPSQIIYRACFLKIKNYEDK